MIPRGFPFQDSHRSPSLWGELPSLRAGWEEAGRDANDDASEVWGTTPGKRGMRRMARADHKPEKTQLFFPKWGLVRGLDSETRLWLHYYIIIDLLIMFYNVFNHVTNDVCPKLGWNLVFASALDGRPTEDLEMGSLPARSPKTFGGRLGTHSWVWVNPLCDPKMDGFRVERSKHDPNLWVIPQLRSGFDPWKLARSELRLDRDGCKQLQTWFRRPQTTADVEVPTSTKEIISIPFFSTKNRPVLFHSHRWHLFALSPSGTIRQLLRVWADAPWTGWIGCTHRHCGGVCARCREHSSEWNGERKAGEVFNSCHPQDSQLTQWEFVERTWRRVLCIRTSSPFSSWTLQFRSGFLLWFQQWVHIEYIESVYIYICICIHIFTVWTYGLLRLFYWWCTFPNYAF